MPIAIVLLAFTTGCADHILAAHNQAPANERPREANSAPSPDTSKWQVYRNEKYGFQLKCPNSWGVHSSTGNPADIIYFSGPFRGSVRPQLDLAIQPNMNPHKLSVEEWLEDQLRGTGLKLETTGRFTIGSQPAVFMEKTTRSGRVRVTFLLLHQTDVLAFSYELGSDDNPTYVAIINSFRVLK